LLVYGANNNERRNGNGVDTLVRAIAWGTLNMTHRHIKRHLVPLKCSRFWSRNAKTWKTRQYPMKHSDTRLPDVNTTYCDTIVGGLVRSLATTTTFATNSVTSGVFW